MAEIVEAPNWASVPTRGRQKYPLDQWVDGQARHLERGVDYTGTTKNFITNLRKSAKERHDVELRYAEDSDGKGVTIQAFNLDKTPIVKADAAA